MAFMPIWKDGVKMIIKSIMTDEDRKALEYMLSLEYAMPYQLLKTKNNRSNGVQGVQTRLKRKDRFESK